MEFIGREKELGLLKGELARESSLILVTGRRRVGKTRLIKEFIDGRGAMYYFAQEMNGPMMLRDFSAALSRHTGRTYGEFVRWRDAFRAFAESSDGRKILVIDEFPNMIGTEGGFLSMFQEVWDEVLSKSSTTVILCGSHMTVMESLDKDRDSPLYGRFSRHIVVNPLPFATVYASTGGEFTEAVERYAVLGGVPRYMELFDGRSLRENVLDNVMDRLAMMFDDPKVLLGEEVKNVATYMSVVAAVAGGSRRISDIASAIQVPATTLTSYLSRLIDIRVLRRTVPATERNPERSRSGLYSVADNYTAFWFRFVRPYMSELELGHTEWAMSRFDAHFVEDHAAFVFEDICREQTRSMSGIIGFTPERVGSYWSRVVEVDVLAINDSERRAFAAECKYHKGNPVDNHVLNHLRRKVASIPELEGYDVTLGLFSVSGFDERVMSERDVVLVDRGVPVDHRPAKTRHG